MSEENKYRNYSVADIEKYHKGLLSPKEMNELEKAALDDPFLADALEGYGNTQVNISADMNELENKLAQRVNRAKVVPLSPAFNIYRFLKIAAVIVFVAGSAFFLYKVEFNSSKQTVAVNQKEQAPPPQIPVVLTDTSKHESIVINKVPIGSRNIFSKPKPLSTWPIADGDTKAPAGAAKQSKSKEVSDDTQNNTTASVVAPNSSDSLKIQNSNNLNAESKPALYDVAAGAANNQQKKNKADDKLFKQSQPTSIARAAEVSDQDLKKSVVTNYFRGRVTDNNNTALPFANISNVKDNVGTYADAQGNFTLISPDSVLNVRVKSVGFVTDTIQLQGVANYNKVVLKEEHLLGVTLGGKRQEKIPSPEENIKAEESEPADGWTNYNLYVANNIKIPDDTKEKELHQEVKLSFEVNKLGEPIDIKVEKSNCKECDDEAVRLVKDGPKWKPKKKKSRVTLTIPF